MPADRERSMNDDLRQKIVDLKEQLEQEKYKVKQVIFRIYFLFFNKNIATPVSCK